MNLVKGTIYETKSFGKAEYCGLDHFMGETTYKFLPVKYPGYRFLLPSQVEDELAGNFPEAANILNHDVLKETYNRALAEAIRRIGFLHYGEAQDSNEAAYNNGIDDAVKALEALKRH